MSPISASHPVISHDYLPSTFHAPAPKHAPTSTPVVVEDFDFNTLNIDQANFDGMFSPAPAVTPHNEEQELRDTAMHDYFALQGWRDQLPDVLVHERGFLFLNADSSRPRLSLEEKALTLIKHFDENQNEASKMPARIPAKDFFDHLVFQAKQHQGLHTLSAMMLFKGDIVPKDISLGYTHLIAAYKANERNAIFKLGFLYQNGLHDVQTGGQVITLQAEPESAWKLFQKSSQLDHPVSAFYLGKSLEHGHGIERNLPAALNEYKHSADLGYDVAQNHVGILHETDGQPIGTVSEYAARLDDVTAKYYFELAMRQGNPEATFNLAMLLIHSPHVLDKKRGIEMLVDLAQKGDKDAQYTAGKALALDQVPGMPNRDLGLKLLEQASNQQHPQADYLLGILYEKPASRLWNPVLAYKHHFIAAENGNTKSMNSLGLLFRDNQVSHYAVSNSIDMNALGIHDEHIGSRGYHARYDLAAYWLDKAAHADTPETYSGAARNLALMYYKGKNIETNWVQAQRYAQIAQQCGDHQAPKLLNIIEHSMAI